MQKLNVTVDAEGAEVFTAIPQLLYYKSATGIPFFAAKYFRLADVFTKFITRGLK